MPVAAAAKPFSHVLIEGGGKVLFEWESEYVPSVDAKKYHASTGRRVLAGGSRGGGKTRAEVEDALAVALNWPGIPILIARKDLADLKKTVLTEFLKVVPEALWDPKFGGQFHRTENYIKLFNGSIIYFSEMKDVDSHRSANLGRVYLDEMHEIPNGENVMRELGATLRWTTGKGKCTRPQCEEDARELAIAKKTSFEEENKPHFRHPIRQIKMMTNPHGGWLKTQFYTPYKENRLPRGYEYIPFLVFNNPGVDAAYINSLLKNNPQWVRNYVYGEWDSFEHMAYPAFNRAIHTWKGPVPWAQVAYVEGGIDWGSTGTEAHKTSMGLTAKLKTGQYIRFWEHVVQGAPTKTLYAMIREMTSKHRVRRWHSDGSQFISNGYLSSAGVPVSDAPRYQGAIKDGVNLINSLLEVDASGRPQFYVTEDCPQTMAALESYSVDPVTGQYVKKDDDTADDLRYNVMGIATKQDVQTVSIDVKVRHSAKSSTRSGASSILRARQAERHERLKLALGEG